MWSTVSDGVKRISAPQKMGLGGGDDFFNTIGHKKPSGFRQSLQSPVT
jgi:hypothetical protein